jgi:WD40 repeat protein
MAILRSPQSATTPAQPSQSVSQSVVAQSETVTLPSQPVNLDLSSKRGWSMSFNNEVKKELNVELMHTFSHNEPVCCVKFSKDGRYLAAGCFDGKAYIYDAQTGALTW